MPKENVQDMAGSGFRAEIGWKTDGYVQLGTTNPDSPFRFPPEGETPRQRVARLQRDLADAQQAAAETPETMNTPPVTTTGSAVTLVREQEPFSGWFVTLDREGCNRMIRALRRARDAAYGADA